MAVNFTILPYPDEDAEHLARRANNAFRKSGLRLELMRHDGYEPPAVRRRKKAAKSLRRYRRARDASGELLVKLAAQARMPGA